MLVRTLAALSLAACASARPPPDILALESSVLAACDAKDAAALERVMAPEFVISFQKDHATFAYSDKARSIRHWTQPRNGALPTLISDARAVVSGGTAVVFAKITDRWLEAGAEQSATTWVGRARRRMALAREP